MLRPLWSCIQDGRKQYPRTIDRLGSCPGPDISYRQGNLAQSFTGERGKKGKYIKRSAKIDLNRA